MTLAVLLRSRANPGASTPLELPEAVTLLLQSAYATPPRAYHNFEHVHEVLDQYASVPSWDDPLAVALAVLFHDAIYVAGRSDNEAESAALAERSLASHPLAQAVDLARVRALIMLTAQHGSLDATALDHDAALFVDCDMAILGSEPARFAQYERAIANEYALLPEALYRAGRARFLRKLLASPRIYHSALFEARLEQRARANLTQALTAL
jgi:predicted metal-dependent HD superfamily phosphohydrolase